MVVRGEPGVGKSALLQYLLDSAADFRVVRAVGVESEMELPFAALHQLCIPMQGQLSELPGPQSKALGMAFGLVDGRVLDRFLVGLGVLTLWSQFAEQQPLLCVVDDAQWLDQASAEVLAFVARRLLADPVGLVFSAREPPQALTGFPELMVGGLSERDARVLLGSTAEVAVDARIRDRVVAEAQGNPLALLEWQRGLTMSNAAGGFTLPVLPVTAPLSRRIEEGYRRQLEQLPAETQLFLLVAAAEPLGDSSILTRASALLGVPADAVVPAIDAGLIEIAGAVRFRHPLVRSAAYQSASFDDRTRAHQALADVMDPSDDPDRRAWHLAQATPGRDEDVALELERSAKRAERRGGLAAAAAFWERAMALTVDPEQRRQRTLAAATVLQQAGRFKASLKLLASLDDLTLSGLDQARVSLLRGQIAYASGEGAEAAGLLLQAAKGFEPVDIRIARAIYLQAIILACFAGRLASGPDLTEVARAAGAAPPAPAPAALADLLLDGFARLVTDGPAAAAPLLVRANHGFHSGTVSPREEFEVLGVACAAASVVWQDENWHEFSLRYVAVVRNAGALTILSQALNSLAFVHLLEGHLNAAASAIAEAQAINEVTGSEYVPYVGLYLVALRGHEAEASAQIRATVERARARGQGLVVRFALSAMATLGNSLGRYDLALAAAEEADEQGLDWWSHLMLPELIEAAVRNGTPERAAGALERLAESATASGTDWAEGTLARSRALLQSGETAEDLYRQAIECLDRTSLRTELARARLLYGEWLRRERRQREAREQLRAAHDMLTTIGAAGFAERTRIELTATGEQASERAVQTSVDLTARETQVCRLAADGATNAEIAARLFISVHTVDYHLRKAFVKLGIRSRRQLSGSLQKIH
jgi:DNA-binding CsgD family transcriptional regulator